MIKAKKRGIAALIFICALAAVLTFAGPKQGNVFASDFNQNAEYNVSMGLAGSNGLSVTFTETPQGTIEYWLKTKTDLAAAWSGKGGADEQEFLDGGALWQKYDVAGLENLDKDDCNIDGYYYLLIRVKDGGSISQFFKAFSASEVGANIAEVLIDGKSAVEVNYLEAGKEVEISLSTVNATKAVLSVNGEAVEEKAITSNSAVFAFTAQTGENSLTVTPYNDTEEGSSLSLSVIGYSAFDDYNKITAVKVNNTTLFGEGVKMGATASFSIETEKVGTPSDATIIVKSNGQTAELEGGTYNITYTAPGVYSFKVYAVTSIDGFDVYEDYYEDYYNYSEGERPALSLNQCEDTAASGSDYSISATQSNAGYTGESLYQLVKWDAKGVYALTSYQQSPNFTVNFSKKGDYRLEIRVKGEGAGSFEHRVFKDVNVDNAGMSGAESLTLTDINGNAVSTVVAQAPYRITVDNISSSSQYKFVVQTKGQWREDIVYSPTNSFVWIPNKAGSFIVYARMNEAGSYGYYDMTVKKDIEVVDYYSVKSVSLDTDAKNLLVGGTYQLTATVTPTNATNAAVTWSSSDSAIASVDQNGLVTAVAKGSAVITASAGDYSATCDVGVYNGFINTKAGFDGIRNDLTGHYLLTSDIDMGYSQSDASSARTFTYFNKIAGPFSGVLNGDGYTVSNIVVNYPQDVGGTQRWSAGIFGTIAADGAIKNIGFEDIVISSDYNSYVSGGLASVNNGLIENVFMSVKIKCPPSNENPNGGLVGRSQGVIKNCVVVLEAPSTYQIGGIAGNSYATTVDNCWVLSNHSMPVSVNNDASTNSGVFTSLSGMLGATDFSGFDDTVWNAADGELPRLIKASYANAWVTVVDMSQDVSAVTTTATGGVSQATDRVFNRETNSAAILTPATGLTTVTVDINNMASYKALKFRVRLSGTADFHLNSSFVWHYDLFAYGWMDVTAVNNGNGTYTATFRFIKGADYETLTFSTETVTGNLSDNKITFSSRAANTTVYISNVYGQLAG